MVHFFQNKIRNIDYELFTCMNNSTSWNPYSCELQFNPFAKDGLHMINACTIIIWKNVNTESETKVNYLINWFVPQKIILIHRKFIIFSHNNMKSNRHKKNQLHDVVIFLYLVNDYTV